MATKRKKKKQSKGKQFAVIISLVLLLILAYSLFKIFGSNTDGFRKGNFLFIPTGSNYEQTLKNLQNEGFIKDINSFDFLARRANYPQRVKPGKYQILPGMSNYQILRILRSGKQTPVKITINKIRTQTDFINLIAANLEADTLVFRHMLHDNVYLSQFGLDSNTALCVLIPDTYEFWWNTNADNAFRRFAHYYKNFWNDTRIKQAQAKNLTPVQVSIIASIVDEETNYNPEKPTIASVYLNRLHKGMKLQADPTARFAMGDFSIRRITGKVLSVHSPYNTYQVSGLPPGPICTPAKSSLDAVLQAPKTTYLYFCAKADFSGTHSFSSSFAEHQKNARLFQAALNKRGIK
ncbi:MAG: endolytic transglycosylase MltG [Bacteroidetes bacterium]|nr:endolytic transglycosylase MltG [Bacteroidota bacterium]